MMVLYQNFCTVLSVMRGTVSVPLPFSLRLDSYSVTKQDMFNYLLPCHKATYSIIRLVFVLLINIPPRLVSALINNWVFPSSSSFKCRFPTPFSTQFESFL